MGGESSPASDRSVAPLLVGFYDRAIGSVDDLHLALKEERIGHQCELRVLRGGHMQAFAVMPGEFR